MIPFQVSFQIFADGTLIEAKLTVRILLGLLKGSIIFEPKGSLFKLSLLSIPIHTSMYKEEDTKKDDKKSEDRSALESLNIFKKLYQPIVRMLKAVLRNTKLKELDGSLKLGLPDPFQTGMFCAMFYPLREMYYSIIPIGIFTFTPVFSEEVFNASVYGRIHLRIMLMLIPLLQLFIDKEFRMLLKS